MNNFGFIRAAAAVPFGKVADVPYNVTQVISQITEAHSKGTHIIVFPELVLPSYTCGDLFLNSSLLESSIEGLLEICDKTKDMGILTLIGLPVRCKNKLFNCAALLNRGKILGIIPKQLIPNYREFYEARWFSSAQDFKNETITIGGHEVPFGVNFLFREKNNHGIIVGVEICEDIWMPIPPSSTQALNGATIICNLSASNILTAKNEYRKLLLESQSAKCIAGYIYSSCGPGESTTDVVFDGSGFIYENGTMLSKTTRFLRENQIIYGDIDVEKLINERIKMNSFMQHQDSFECINFEIENPNFQVERSFNPHPFVPAVKEKRDERCHEIFNIQASALAKRFDTIPGTKAVIGLSGGLDSTLALLVVIKACELVNKSRDHIIGITMPGFGTTNATYKSVKKLCDAFGISLKISDIKDISSLMFDKLGHSHSDHTTVYENVQARARTYVLMSEANKQGGIVIGTGDLSEIALGWCTYNADHISMYNVNSSVPKTLVKYLINWVAETEVNDQVRDILLEILAHPISPELLPSDGEEVAHKTEDTLGPYELHDFFLYNSVRFGFKYEKVLFMAESAFKGLYPPERIKEVLDIFIKRFFRNQWKRDCVPAGPKIGSLDLSPRGSWRMPAEAEFKIFLDN